jgi:hypothetical protein
VKSTHRPSAGLIVACIALVFAIAGSAVALPGKNTVDKNDIKKGAVTKRALKKGAVTAKALKNGAVTSEKIAEGAVTGGKIADGAVGGAKVQAESLSTDKLSDVSLSPVKKVSATSGPNFDAAAAAAPPQTLVTRGPFTIYGKCFTDTSGPQTYAFTYISTTEAGSVFSAGDDSLAGDPFLDPSTLEEDRELYDDSAGTNNANGFRNQFDAISPSGTILRGLVTQYAKNGTLAGGDGIYGAGDACLLGAAVFG